MQDTGCARVHARQHARFMCTACQHAQVYTGMQQGSAPWERNTAAMALGDQAPIGASGRRAAPQLPEQPPLAANNDRNVA